MSSSFRVLLRDGSFVDWIVVKIKPDRWRPHGLKYRLAWIKDDVCRVLFDNHHGKHDHYHVNGIEKDYQFVTEEKLFDDFYSEIKKLGGLFYNENKEV